MTAIRVMFTGQFGNQLMQYCFAKVLARQTGLCYTPPRFRTKQGHRVTWSGAPLFVLEGTAGRARDEANHIDIACGHWVDRLQFDHATKITCRAGYYQRYEYYQPYRDMIKHEWLRLQVPLLATDPSAVYVHVRRRDYVPTPKRPVTAFQQPLASTIDEYAACLKHFPDARRLILCTDDLRDPFLYQFSRFGLPVTVNAGTWDRDLLTMLSADNLLICQSTFSWWAGFLGRASRIVCPLFQGTNWRLGADGGLHGPPTNGDYPSMCVHDDLRWIWVRE